ncbi:cation diffusion facilitator family transporter [Allostella humosa]|nr:cation transporter [Stella humosa]
MTTVVLTDGCMVASLVAAAIWSNSLIALAESMRGTLIVLLEIVLLLVMRRIHRGRTQSYDYGAGKLEQFVNFSVGLVMGLAGLWVAASAAYRWWHPADQAGLGLAFAVVVGLVNLVQNGLIFWGLWRAGRDGRSVIMIGQIRARIAKVISSCLVLTALAVNAIFGDGPVGTAADVAGSAFVSLVMLQLAVSMCRSALPSLLDRTLAESQQELINRSLIQHFDAYDDLVAVRSRLSGNVPIVEIVLGFRPDRQMGEIQRVVDGVAAEIRELIPDSAITVVPVAAVSR